MLHRRPAVLTETGACSMLSLSCIEDNFSEYSVGWHVSSPFRDRKLKKETKPVDICIEPVRTGGRFPSPPFKGMYNYDYLLCRSLCKKRT